MFHPAGLVDVSAETKGAPALSVVLPALNEELGIEATLDRLLATRPRLAALGFARTEVLVVDDGSTDHTAELVAARAADGVRLLRHGHNRGYGAALKTGFAAARGRWIAFLDADGTYPPEELPGLCQEARRTTADIVVGSRMSGADNGMPALRKLGNIFFARMVSRLVGRHVEDAASGMRVLRREALARLDPLPDGLNLTPVMTTRALIEGMSVVTVPIHYAERIGRSKLSVWRDGWLFARSIVGTSLQRGSLPR